MFKLKVITKDRIQHILNGELHREDGPAVEWYKHTYQLLSGHGGFILGREWYKNGRLHRLDGPAMEFEDGSGDWYIDGQYLKHQTNDVQDA